MSDYRNGKPRCCNHGVELIDCNYKDGVGICPISYCEFTFESDSEEKIHKQKINALGELVEVIEWTVKGDEK